MREPLTVAGTRLVNRTVIAIQELTTLRIAAQDQGVVFIAGRVFLKEEPFG
jgi:hypothetical protein